MEGKQKEQGRRKTRRNMVRGKLKAIWREEGGWRKTKRNMVGGKAEGK
jgi:muconolactone delta-isomerase